ncbi:MAG: hypothetical protein ACM3KF_02010 [Acidobacteriota bacterium]
MKERDSIAMRAGNPEAELYVPESHPELLDETAYAEKAVENLLKTSRTASGTIDTSASATKSDIMAIGSGEQVANLSRINFEATIRWLYEQREHEFTSAEELRTFVERTVLAINNGITTEGTIYRAGQDAQNKYGYTRIADIEAAMQEFCTGLYAKLADPIGDPVETAGWIEYHIDVTDHFFADGCGKISKAIAAYALMRNTMPLPTYRSREEHYGNAPQHIRGDNPVRDIAEYDKWMTYYRSLFEEGRQ